ncbi:LamB/YcsF family protein [Alteribacter natronophilus]|uniref:LamB/YcsF family protein n=1 Tax=Alteribacter natronophilus TaxID=2583810 RepID=UPI00110E6F6D|nr:5-oxoprolinase subunit PxpA [Alteribacter natronophilus]TMW72079.1 LamB/YcsF family protein [Alteribacter natronophilus]
MRIDLNCDLGESFGNYTIGQDEDVLQLVSSANIACGYHAGDHNVMKKTVRLAAEAGVGLGAHPGLPDLGGFGRRYIEVQPEDVYNMVVYQIGALEAFVRIEGERLQHVKPHGALFNMASKDRAIADAIARAVKDVDESLILFGLAGSELVMAGREHGLTVAREVFADRSYQPDGTLTPRTEPGAVIEDEDEVTERVLRMIREGVVTASDGSEVALEPDTICVHGDGPKALAFVSNLRKCLQEAGVQVRKVGER